MKNIIKISVFASILFVLAACGSEEKQTLEGKIKRETVSIAPKVAGRIERVLVKESDVVKAGDTLAVINVPEVEAKILQAEGAVLAATSQYEMALNGATKEEREQITAMYNAANEQYQFAEKSYKRISNMFNDSLVTAQQYDEILAKYNSAKAQLDAAFAKKTEVMNGVRNEKIRMALGQKAQAEGALKEAKTAYNERYIVAPKEMTIETIALHEGELALPGYNIFVGYNTQSSYFRFTVQESKVSKFQKGKEYEIELPFSNLKTKAQLVAVKELAKYATKTSAYPNYQLGETVYELKLIPQDKKAVENLFDNYTAIISF